MLVTEKTLLRFAPQIKPNDVQTFLKALEIVEVKWEVNTPRRMRYFMAQAYYETQNFTKFEENLRYTAKRLCEVWPSRFTMIPDQKKAYAPDYAMNPVKLANKVYANRYGNGDEVSGDGSKFIGRGAFHLTFRDNYLSASQYIYGDDRLVVNPELVATDLIVGFETAGWFWKTKKLNVLADNDEFTKTTKIINGSDATVPLRLPVLRRANETL